MLARSTFVELRDRGFEPHSPHTISRGNSKMMKLRTAPGMRERAPDVREIVQAGRDPVTGKDCQVSRTFRGTMRESTRRAARDLPSHVRVYAW